MCLIQPMSSAQLAFHIREDDRMHMESIDESLINIIMLLRHLDTIHKTLYALCIVLMIHSVGKIVFMPIPIKA